MPMHNPASQSPRTYKDHIARALATPDGHLAIGRGGATLYFGNGRLSSWMKSRSRPNA
jgi:hypothetical protein